MLHGTGSHLLAGLAFGIGLVALFLAHGELFTEGFLLPVMALFAGRGTPLQLVRLWGVTLLTNLAGGWVFMWLVARAFPEFEEVRFFIGGRGLDGFLVLHDDPADEFLLLFTPEPPDDEDGSDPEA
mgnify:CR=1 FL=1